MHFRYQCAIMLSDRYVAVLRERRETNGYKYIIGIGNKRTGSSGIYLGKQSLRNQCCKDQGDFNLSAGYACPKFTSEYRRNLHAGVIR